LNRTQPKLRAEGKGDRYVVNLLVWKGACHFSFWPGAAVLGIFCFSNLPIFLQDGFPLLPCRLCRTRRWALRARHSGGRRESCASSSLKRAAMRTASSSATAL